MLSSEEILDSLNMDTMGTYGWGKGDAPYQMWAQSAARDEQRFKALTTGTGVVTDGTTGGAALRVQYLHDMIENTSYSQTDAKGMSLIPYNKAYSTTIEYTTAGDYGQGGDAFIDETGTDGAFNVDYADDNYKRNTELIAYMAEAREVGLVEQEVRNQTDPFALSKLQATKALIGKANRSLYFGDRLQNGSSFNGLRAQMVAWVLQNPWDEDIFVDCAGQPLDRYMLEDGLTLNQNKFGKVNLLIQSSLGKGDSNKLLFPEQRGDEGDGKRKYGKNYTTFDGPNGEVRVEGDAMLRPGEPLRVDGPGSDGKPRLTSAATGLSGPDANALSFSATPFVASSGGNGCQATSPGTNSCFANKSFNTDNGPFATLPSLPSNGKNNNLVAGTHYYAVAPVYRGREGAMYIYGAGAQSANVITGSPTGIAVTAGQVVQLDFNFSQINSSGNYTRSNVSWRVYKYTGTSAPTRVDQFKYLDTCGTPTAGNARIVDNGFKIAGTDNAVGITTVKDGMKGWEFLQLLPLMRRMGLPAKAMSDPMVLLWFATPILWRRRQHIWFYNIGRAL